jgi:hypothetical protein
MKTLVRMLAWSCCLLTLFAEVYEYAQASSRRIIPTPQRIEPKQGVFRITSQTRVVLGEGTKAEDEFAAELIVERIAELRGSHIRVVKESALRRVSANFIYVGTTRSEVAKDLLRERGGSFTSAMREEGYVLDVNDDGVAILAETPRGRYYGVLTLLQVIERQKKSVVIPGVSIHDWPRQRIRGVTDDISRGQVSTLGHFKKIIRFLSHHKMNVYALYIEDVFQFKKHPAIGVERGALSAAEVKELDAFARMHHVDLIPIFQTLGHWENILILPEYAEYAEFPGAHTLNVSDERVYKLLDDLIGEIALAFSSPYFHFAADESWDVGLGASKARVASSDIETVHASHYKRVGEILKKHKKKPMMYGDVLLNHPGILDKIPKEIIVVDWQYHAAETYVSTATLKQAKLPFVVSPAVMNFTGPFPNYLNTFINVKNLNRDGYLNGSLGLLTSNWNDYGGEAFRELNYYGYAWSAECAWNPLRADATEFGTAFFCSYFGVTDPTPARAAYALLAEPFNRYDWHELWRHPMLPPRASSMNMLWRIESIESTMPLVRSLISELREQATENKDHLAYLDFVSRLNEWFAHKLRVAEQARMMSRTETGHAVNDSTRAKMLLLMESTVSGLMTLKEEFRALWLKTCREANLDRLLARYDRQAAYWQEWMEEIRTGATRSNPEIASSWIYHPKIEGEQRKSYFRTSVLLERAPRSAPVQLIGDTHARLWVNGNEIGEVVARRSLSLVVEHQRVKAWDVARYLQPGLNVIAVEAANYDVTGSAGVNVYGEFIGDSMNVSIVSDSTWKASATASEGWNRAGTDDGDWEAAIVRPHATPVVRPNFATGRLSWIER